MAKQLYHKELRDMSPVSVTVKSERQKSTYSKPNAPKPDYVTLVLNGEERYYITENEACAAFFTGKRGQTFSIVAAGSRDDATITYVGQPAATLPPPVAAQQPPPRTATQPGPAQEYVPPAAAAQQPSAGPTAKPARNDVHEAEIYVARRSAGHKITLRAAMALAAEFQEASNITMPWDMVQSINSTLFIAGDRAGMWDALPANLKFTMPKPASS